MTDLQHFMHMVSKGDFSKVSDNGNQIVKLIDNNNNQVNFIFDNLGQFIEFKIVL